MPPTCAQLRIPNFPPPSLHHYFATPTLHSLLCTPYFAPPTLHPLLCTKTTAVLLLLLLSFAFKNQAVQSIACKAKGVAKQGVQRKGGVQGKGCNRKSACPMYVFLFVAANLLPFPVSCTRYFAPPLSLHPLLCTPPMLCTPCFARHEVFRKQRV